MQMPQWLRQKGTLTAPVCVNNAAIKPSILDRFYQESWTCLVRIKLHLRSPQATAHVCPYKSQSVQQLDISIVMSVKCCYLSPASKQVDCSRDDAFLAAQR